MRLAKFHALVWGLAALCAGPASAAVDGFPLYRTIDPSPDPNTLGYATDMNARDQVVGVLYNPPGGPGALGFRWTRPDKVDFARDFRSGYWSSELGAISDDGTAVGYGFVQAAGDRFVKRALLMRPNGRRVALPHPGLPDEHSVAVDVSKAGAIGVVYSDTGWAQYSVRWSPDGTVHRLNLPGEVVAINDRGDIVSYLGNGASLMETAAGQRHPIPFGQVLTLNNDGVVAGRGGPRSNEAVIWSAEGGLEVLPRPPQLPQAACYAQQVNRQGQVVGHCDPTNDNLRALTWLRIDGVWQVADLAWQVPDGTLNPKAYQNALRITDNGHILVDGGTGIKILVPIKKR